MGCRSELGKDLAIKEENVGSGVSERRKEKASARAQSSDVVAAAPFRRYLKWSYVLYLISYWLIARLTVRPDKGRRYQNLLISVHIIEKQVARLLWNANPKGSRPFFPQVPASSWRPWAADILTIQNSDPTSVRSRTRFLWCHFRPKCNDFLWICPPTPKKIISRLFVQRLCGLSNRYILNR